MAELGGKPAEQPFYRPPQRFCAQCGTAFEPERPTQYHCSAACVESEQTAGQVYQELNEPQFDHDNCPLAQWFRARYGDAAYYR